MARERLSLVVCTLDRPEAVQRLLDGVAAQDRRPDEILVIDASDDDATREVVERHPVGIGHDLTHVPVTHAERGLTRQRNRGIDLATGTVVAFLDDDTVPTPAYFAELERCLERHPDAVGVGGSIDEGGWRRAGAQPVARGWYRRDGWERPEGARWRVRRALGLAGDTLPGHLPPAGHGRPVAFLPPSGLDYPVEFVMGGASAWRRELFDAHRFSSRFAGYGLYEDLDFCIRAGAEGPLILCTRAQLRHDHDPAARPHPARYGRMVVENGWYVWRRRWPAPKPLDRARWWLTTLVLCAVRLVNAAGPEGRTALFEAGGRLVGMAATAPAEVSTRYRAARGLTAPERRA